ncbi:MAG TPA: DUF167 domain-containing protein [Pyrinomonadaceae bacterium]|nr:DUF167 domain-containing protein [Pyrinomonadaceae bacterium]
MSILFGRFGPAAIITSDPTLPRYGTDSPTAVPEFYGIYMQPRILQIKVKPNSRNSLLEEQEDGTWLAQIKSPPVEGKANEELITLLAKHFRCRKSAVSIKAGASGRVKLVRIKEP